MRRIDPAFALVLCACIASCAPQEPAPATPPAADVSPAIPAAAGPVADEPAAVDDPNGFEAPTAAEARQVVVDYYAALNARDYRKAYALWSDDGAASGQSFEHFSGGYASTESVEATVGDARDEEGAAGSRYIAVPVELRARQYNGTVRSYRGRFALRAVVADGASEPQRRWHLASADLQRFAD